MSEQCVQYELAPNHPAYLYWFRRADREWYYTSADFDIDYFGTLWKSANIGHGRIAQGGESSRNGLELTASSDIDLAKEYISVPDFGVVTLTVYRIDLIDENLQQKVVWSGRLLNCSILDEKCTLTCEPVTVSLKRNGLRRIFSLTCSHVLYGTGCKVAPITMSNTVVENNGGVLALSDSMDDNFFAGGWVQNADGSRRTMIISNDAFNINLIYPTKFQPEDVVTLYAGCNHTLGVCDEKFANSDNFGGFPWIPDQNPFNDGIFT